MNAELQTSTPHPGAPRIGEEFGVPHSCGGFTEMQGLPHECGTPNFNSASWRAAHIDNKRIQEKESLHKGTRRPTIRVVGQISFLRAHAFWCRRCANGQRIKNEVEKGIEELERHSSDSGWIEVITGSMFSGKSEELIRRLRRAQIARQKVQIFKPAIDLRFSNHHIVSHSEMKIASQAVKSANEILAAVEIDTNVVGIDEGQFFDQDLVRVVNILADQGKRVIIAGLDMDYLGRPFEPMPLLLAIAEDITKTRAICVRCGSPATYTQRLIESRERVVVGAADAYEARCRGCFDPHLSENAGD